MELNLFCVPPVGGTGAGAAGRVQAVQAAALSRTRTDRDRLETTKELVVGCGAKQFLFLGARFYAELFVLPLPVRLDMAEEGNCGSPLKTGE